MKKAASAFLRMEICHADITRMIRWMRNPNVNKYLNEAPDVAQSLEQLVRFVPKPMYQYQLCRTGHFFMVCHQENESVGFVKLLPTAMEGVYESVCDWRGCALGSWAWSAGGAFGAVEGVSASARRPGCCESDAAESPLDSLRLCLRISADGGNAAPDSV